jgi:hypothetical protein
MLLALIDQTTLQNSLQVILVSPAPDQLLLNRQFYLQGHGRTQRLGQGERRYIVVSPMLVSQNVGAVRRLRGLVRPNPLDTDALGIREHGEHVQRQGKVVVVVARKTVQDLTLESDFAEPHWARSLPIS